MSLSAGLLRISRTASSPVSPGIITSRTARSGCELTQASTAELPSATVTIWCPRVASLNSTRSRMSTSSSATTMSATSRSSPWPCVPEYRAAAGSAGQNSRNGRSELRRPLRRAQHLNVPLGLAELLEQPGHAVLRGQAAPQPLQDGVLLVAEQRRLVAGAGLDQVDRREDLLLRERAVEA